MPTRIHVPPHFDTGTPWGDLWEDLLEKWLLLVKSYEQPKASDEGAGLGHWYDLSYWYGERPLTGLLAAAAWQIKGWSIEESGVVRVGRSGKHHNGRFDLWLGRGQVASSVEAKLCWVDVQDCGKVDAMVRRKLKKAKKQLRKVASLCQREEAACQVVCRRYPYRNPRVSGT